MSQDTLKVRVVINQGGENQSDLEAPLKPVSGVEQAQVIRTLQSGKMNETSDSYAVEEKYTYNYSRIFGTFFLMVAFFVAATSYFVGRTQPPESTGGSQAPTESLLPSKNPSGAKSPIVTQSTDTVATTPANENVNQAATPVSSLQLIESLTNVGRSEAPAGSPEVKSTEKTELTGTVPSEKLSVTSVVTPAVIPSVNPSQEVTATSIANVSASSATIPPSDIVAPTPTTLANIGNLQTRILEPALVMNPAFLGSMIKKEPGIPLASQIPFDENHLIRVFFYVETKNLKGKWLRQHWYYQDKKMATVTSFVNANAFKTHSSKFIRHNWAGKWQVVVSVVDQPNQAETKEKKLVEGQFDIGVESR
jgi:Protein of unknown function (DUF2914)